jgi:kynurenine formamidase
LYFDLSHTLGITTPVYPGDPKVELSLSHSFEDFGFSMLRFQSGLHVGTHIDAPLHMIPSGKKLSDYPAEKFIGPGRLLDLSDGSRIDAAGLKKFETQIRPGDIAVLYTGWSKHFGSEKYFLDYPEVQPDFAHRLVELGVKILAMDLPSPDRAPFVVHKILLGADVLIVENLCNLASLKSLRHFEIMACPMKIDAEAAPLRVIARGE